MTRISNFYWVGQRIGIFRVVNNLGEVLHPDNHKY